jgi:hypothetical protein
MAADGGDLVESSLVHWGSGSSDSPERPLIAWLQTVVTWENLEEADERLAAKVYDMALR